MPETLHTFVSRLSRAVGCYYDKNVKNYSLKAFDSSARGIRGVFAWVNEPVGSGPFSISAHKNLAEKANVMNLIDREKGNTFRERGHEIKDSTPTVYFFVGTDSEGDDFKRVVKALNAIMNAKKQTPRF